MVQSLFNITTVLPLTSLTMKGAESAEITEIIWIYNAMRIFFKFGKKIKFVDTFSGLLNVFLNFLQLFIATFI